MSLIEFVDALDFQQTWRGWLIGVAIVAPAAAYGSLAFLRGLHGSWRLVPPHCPRCRHQQRTGTMDLPERCAECGHPLSGGVPWVRRARTGRGLVGWIGLALVCVALGIGAGGWTYAIVIDPTAEYAAAEYLDDLLAGSKGGRGVMRGLQWWAQYAEQSTVAEEAPRAAILIACLTRDGRDGPIAQWMHSQGLAQARDAPLALATLLSLGVIDREQAWELMQLFDVAPRFRFAASAPPGGRYVVGWTTAQGLSVTVDDVLIDGASTSFEKIANGVAFALPALERTAQIELGVSVAIRPAVSDRTDANDPIEVRRLSPRTEVALIRDGPNPPPMNTEGWQPFIARTPIPEVEVRRVGDRIVARATLPQRAPGIVLRGDWTIEVDGASAPLVEVDQWRRGRDLQALLPPAPGRPTLPARATIRFVPRLTSDSSAPFDPSNCAWPDPIVWLDVSTAVRR